MPEKTTPIAKFAAKIEKQLKGYEANNLPRTAFIVDPGKFGWFASTETNQVKWALCRAFNEVIAKTGYLTETDILTCIDTVRKGS